MWGEGGCRGRGRVSVGEGEGGCKWEREGSEGRGERVGEREGVDVTVYEAYGSNLHLQLV